MNGVLRRSMHKIILTWAGLIATYPEGFPRARFVSQSTFQFPLPTKQRAEEDSRPSKSLIRSRYDLETQLSKGMGGSTLETVFVDETSSALYILHVQYNKFHVTEVARDIYSTNPHSWWWRNMRLSYGWKYRANRMTTILAVAHWHKMPDWAKSSSGLLPGCTNPPLGQIPYFASFTTVL